MKRLSLYNKKHLLYLLLVFILFLVIIFYSEYRNERKYRIEALNKELDGYATLIDNYIRINTDADFKDNIKLSPLLQMLPDTNMRVTLIDISGKVFFDSRRRDISNMENHLSRPEISSASANHYGTDIRISNTTGIKYYYYAKRLSDYFIRLSLEYNIDTKSIIEPNKLSLFSIVILFLISFLVLVWFNSRFNLSVANLKQFTMLANANVPIKGELSFPSTELGTIGQEIIDIYQKLNTTKQELIAEKEKLVRHLDTIEEGIAIFTSDKKIIVSNSNFISYINLISEKLVYSPEYFFDIGDFGPLLGFIEHQTSENSAEKYRQPSYEININKNGKYFTVKCIAFQDKTFELLINDNTKPAKRKLLKQQITDNIAHELKTPISSVKGFLETVLNNKLDSRKQTDFLRKAYTQTCRLTDLIDDISLLTKIEEAGSLYKLELVNLSDLVSNVIEDVHIMLKEQKLDVAVNIPETVEFYGNQVLLYSVFRNLFDNAINYAGKNIRINIEKYSEDDQNFFFSFYDTGSGVPEQDLPRLFERFYRVEKSRDRKSGGTGLGLAIVKNAIEFHKGVISVKNRQAGGLEFLFSINRKLQETV